MSVSKKYDTISLLQALNRGISTGGITTVKKITGAELGVDGAAYTSGDTLGDQSPIEITDVFRSDPNGNTAILQSITVQDLSKQSLPIDIIIFDSNPTNTTFTDNAALDIADADLPKVLGVVSVVATDYAAFNDSSVATKNNIGLTLQGNHTSIWIACVTRDAPTYVADEVSLVLGFLQD